MGHTIRILIWPCSEWGFTIAVAVTRNAVRSYRTISPLLSKFRQRYTFCCTFRKLSPPRGYLALCPMEPGLSSQLMLSDCLAGSPHIILYHTKIGIRTTKSLLPCRNCSISKISASPFGVLDVLDWRVQSIYQLFQARIILIVFVSSDDIGIRRIRALEK